jgi:hypothetical protein
MSNLIETPYAPPVDQLLKLGRPEDKWIKYLELGLTQDDVPGLIRLMRDPALISDDAQEPEVFAPIHAWRALGQLGAVQAAEPMLKAVRLLDEQTGWGLEWAQEDLYKIFEILGPATIPLLIATLSDESENVWVRDIAAHGLAQLSYKKEVADQCISALIDQMGRFKQNPRELNGLLIVYLTDLNERKSADVIRNAFLAGVVDDFMVTWGNVRESLAIPKADGDPPEYGAIGRMRESIGLPPTGSLLHLLTPPRQYTKERRDIRAKRKAERKARKQNRRR